MFCIYQLDDKSNETIVDLIDSKDKYLPKIVSMIKDKHAVKSLDGLHFNDIKSMPCFGIGHYLLNNGFCVELVSKYEVIESGYIYESTKIETKILFTWKLLPLENKTIKFTEAELYINLETSTDSPCSEIVLRHQNNIFSEKLLTETDSDTDIQFNSFEEQLVDNDYELPTFELDFMPVNPSILLIAKRGSGKSFVIRNIINHAIDDEINPIKELIIMSKTERMSPFYKNHYPNAKILYDYDSTTIKEYLAKRHDREYMQNNRGCIVLDDCISSNSGVHDSPDFLELIYNGRHYNTTFIMTQQFPHGLKPEIRGNFDCIFLLAEDSFSNQKRIYDHYAGRFPNLETFRNYFIEATKDFGCMVINNGSRGRQAYRFKAQKFDGVYF